MVWWFGTQTWVSLVCEGETCAVFGLCLLLPWWWKITEHLRHSQRLNRVRVFVCSCVRVFVCLCVCVFVCLCVIVHRCTRFNLFTSKHLIIWKLLDQDEIRNNQQEQPLFAPSHRLHFAHILIVLLKCCCSLLYSFYLIFFWILFYWCN